MALSKEMRECLDFIEKERAYFEDVGKLGEQTVEDIVDPAYINNTAAVANAAEQLLYRRNQLLGYQLMHSDIIQLEMLIFTCIDHDSTLFKNWLKWRLSVFNGTFDNSAYSEFFAELDTK